MSYLCVGVLFTVCAGVMLQVRADQEMKAEGTTLKVLGNSGKMQLTSSSTIDENSTDTVTFTMDFIKEVDSAGNEVGTSGNLKHTFNTFASTPFSFSSLRDEKFQNLDVKAFDFQAYMAGPKATVKFMVYIFKQDGEIDVGQDQTAQVKKGVFKFNVKIMGWEFCTAALSNCQKGQTKEVGAFIEFGIEIKSSKKPEKSTKPTGCKKECADEYDLGNDEKLSVPSQAKDNGTAWVTMPNGYPKVDEKNKKFLMTFRFPKFNGTIEYDPTVAHVEGTSAGSPLQAGGAAMLLMALLALLYVY